MRFRQIFSLRSLIFIISFMSIIFSSFLCYAVNVKGLVFEDINLNNRFDAGERGIAGVGISNGEIVVLTNGDGRYSLEMGENKILFVIKPSGYDFFEGRNTHKPAFYKFIENSDGVGNGLNDVNFPLIKSNIPDKFSAVILGDMQVTDDEEIDYLRDSTIPELSEERAAFILTLGDNANNNLDVYPRLTSILGMAGKTIYYLPGNHDTNDKIEGPDNHYNIYRQFFGPDYYSFNYGKVHFIVLNDIKWENGVYHGELGIKQLNWIKEDLKYVQRDSLIVLAMHIPLISWVDRNNPNHSVKDRDELFNLLSDFDNVIALAGHTHDLEKLYPGELINGWSNGLTFPQIIAGAVCGSWWQGEKDEFGIPFSYMKDGAPKGYFVMQFDDSEYTDTYKATGKPSDYQVNINLFNNNVIQNDSTISIDEINNSEIISNVFNADIYSNIDISFDGDEYSQMEKVVTIDPFINERVLGNTLPVESTHIWRSKLPTNLGKGVHLVRVRFIDKSGHKYVSSKIIEIK